MATASPNQITLNWSASSDNLAVTSYRVYRSDVGGGLTPIVTLGNVTTYTNTGLTAATSYTYTVDACDAAGNCSAQSGSASATTLAAGSTFTASLEPGFNLIGNSLNITIDMPATFGNQDAPVAGITPNIVSIWKWNAAAGRWAFYSPQLTGAGIASFAASKNYEVLAVINPGEGYWVNAATQMTLPAQTGTDFDWNGVSFSALPSGFNLIAHAGNVTPSEFNIQVSATSPAQGVEPTDNFISLWTWDAVTGDKKLFCP